MGITRATSGPVRCPWCARPVSDGADRPDICPSCGIPLARTGPDAMLPVPVTPRPNARRAQRLRALSAVLGLTAAVMAVAAVATAPALLRQGRDDQRARNNLIAVLRAAEEVRRDTGQFNGASNAQVLQGRVFGIHVVEGLTPSPSPAVVSMTVQGDGWYGAVHSTSGACLAAATLSGDPKILEAVLPGNCTGDAARATLSPQPPPASSITAPGEQTAPGTSPAATGT